MAGSNWSLAELLAPLTMSEFRRDYWGRRPFATQIPDGALAWLRDELAGFDIPKLVRRNRGLMTVWFADLEGQHHTIPAANAEVALALYNDGKTIFLRDGGTAPIILWQRRLAIEVGHPTTLPLTSSLFLSRRSAGTIAHFDMLENFTIQLSGHKRWRVGANSAVRQPLENWILGQSLTPSLERTLEQPLPDGMPSECESFDLVAGSLLYIPRGHFHETDSALDSASLFLGMSVATWADLLLDGMRARLNTLPHWRENFQVGTSPAELAQARQRFDDLRAGLTNDLRGLDSAFMLPDLRGALDGTRQLRRNPLAMMQVRVDGGDLTVDATLPLGQLPRRESFTLPAQHAPLFEWLGSRTTFTVDEVAAAHPDVERTALLELLAVLQRAGLFT